MAESLRLLVDRRDLHRTRTVPDPDAPAARPLADGQARYAIERYALTANNVTYAAFGDAMHYWGFFPTGDAQTGCVPVWGYARCVESRVPGIEVGQRCYGYWPMGSHLVVQPARVRERGFVDAMPHRTALPAVYNAYIACAHDPLYDAEAEGLQALLRPLFTTSFLLDDFCAEHADFGARQIVLSSASSKTAWGTAFCIGRRAGHPARIGLTSRGNLAYVRGLGLYEQVVAYDDLAALDPAVPTTYIDFAGDRALRGAIHRHWRGALCHSGVVGGSHWESLHTDSGELPGPKPAFFFAPAQVEKRSAEPPQGLGRAGFEAALGAAWHAMTAAATKAAPPWIVVREAAGSKAIQSAFESLVAGRADPRDGLVLSP